ncbi:folate/biopterin transporter / FT5 [Leishmania donovani]|uniref:BT1 family protein n=1 Tax=Leishmania donovani TaxID=5661 RepID=Q9UAB8_LEIDO|nr:putative pteridine transporter FT5 [Leishmania donovani]TPP51597.1 BT1 family protein [Leishmania donovani]TPP54464.1 BT1 family protein [Leishmania donovani]CAJ1986716.1 folate/biopterin transporter / FT5 [Leishmania donovani]VDZ42612.1 pteridine_transporter_(truncated)_putative/GeneDB:LmjF.04.0020 [Leishmania donovani]
MDSPSDGRVHDDFTPGSPRAPDQDAAAAARQQKPATTGGLQSPVDGKAHLAHPEATSLFVKCPWMRHVPIFSEAAEGYGPKVVVSLGMCYFLCKGIADQLISYSRQPMFMSRYGIDGQRYQRLAGISTMGWSIKALTAMLCDGFAFLGYTKRWYMFVSCLGGAVFALLYGLLPARPASADIAAAFVFLCSYGKANVDILSEGHYSRLMRFNPRPGPALVSWIWLFIMVGAIVAAAIQGPLSDQGKQQVGVFISAVLQCVTGVFFLFNWYGERKNRVERAADAALLYEDLRKERVALGLLPAQDSRHVRSGKDDVVALVNGAPSGAAVGAKKNLHPENHLSDEEGVPELEQRQREALEEEMRSDALVVGEEEDEELADDEYLPYEVPHPVPCLFGLFEMNKEVIIRNWKIFVYSIVMTCSVVAMTCGSILADTLGLLIICVVISTICCATSFWAMPLVIAKANVFGYLQMTVYLQLPGALDSFYLANAECLPDGPHFTYTFYNTVAAVIGNIGGLIGVTAFNYIFSKHSYRLTFCITTVVQIIASVFDIIMVKRWNVYIGIPDHAMYICGDAVVYQVCYMLAWMPMIVLLSRLCPRGSESVVYALMAGFSNLGQTTSSSLGAIIMEYGWSITTTPPCNFSNVPWLLLVGHIMLPLLVIPLTLLIPNARICDDLDVDGKAVKSAVSHQVALDAAQAEDGFEENTSSVEAADVATKDLQAERKRA